MLFKTTIQTIALGCALWVCLLFSTGQNPTMAATVDAAESASQEQVQTLPETNLKLKSEVDRFLTAMPSGYYTISNVTGLKDLLKDPQTILVDVREPSEYGAGHIPDAINSPLRTLTHNLDKIPSDRPVVLYCSTGYRSAMGVMTLHLLGYDNVRGFPPSFAGWKTAGEAIATSSRS